MADDFGQGATSAAQNAMEIPGGLGQFVSGIPGMNPNDITPQPHMTAPPVPKPLMHENNPGWQNTSGKPLSRGGEKKANTYNAIAAAGNMIGKFTNKQKEDKYEKIQYDMQRYMEAAQAATEAKQALQNPNLSPEQKKMYSDMAQHNEGIASTIITGKNGKDIQKIFGDINPFGESKDPAGQQALRKANEAVQKKAGMKQMIGNFIQKTMGGGAQGQPQAQPQGPRLPSQAPQLNALTAQTMQHPTAIPGANPNAPGASIPPGLMSGAPVNGGTRQAIVGPSAGAQPGVTGNPSQGNSATQAIAPASNAAQGGEVKTPYSDKLMSMFPTVPGLSRTATMQMQMLKEFQPMIVQQMKMAEELIRIKGDLSLADHKLQNQLALNQMQWLKSVDLQRLKAQYGHDNLLFGHSLRMKEIGARMEMFKTINEPVKKLQAMNIVKGNLETEFNNWKSQIGNLDKDIANATDPAVKKALEDKKKEYTNNQLMTEQHLKTVTQEVGTLAAQITGNSALLGIGDDINGVSDRFSGSLTDTPSNTAIYGDTAKGNTESNSIRESESDFYETGDSPD